MGEGSLRQECEANLVAIELLKSPEANGRSVNGLTRSTGLEFARQGLCVNDVVLGAIQTPRTDRFVGESKTNNSVRDWLTSVHPVGLVGTTD